MAQDNLDAFMLLKGIKGECLDGTAADRASEWGFSDSATIEIDSITISSTGAEFAPKRKNPYATKEERDRDRYEDSDDGKGKYTFTVTKVPDSSTPDLFYKYCQTAYDRDSSKEAGRIEKAVLWIRKAGPEAIIYLRWELTKVWVIQFDWQVNEDGSVTETLQLYPYKMTVFYHPQSSAGEKATKQPISRSYDLVSSSDE